MCDMYCTVLWQFAICTAHCCDNEQYVLTLAVPYETAHSAPSAFRHYVHRSVPPRFCKSKKLAWNDLKRAIVEIIQEYY
jgi:hypothetical protein